MCEIGRSQAHEMILRGQGLYSLIRYKNKVVNILQVIVADPMISNVVQLYQDIMSTLPAAGPST